MALDGNALEALEVLSDFAPVQEHLCTALWLLRFGGTVSV